MAPSRRIDLSIPPDLSCTNIYRVDCMWWKMERRYSESALLIVGRRTLFRDWGRFGFMNSQFRSWSAGNASISLMMYRVHKRQKSLFKLSQSSTTIQSCWDCFGNNRGVPWYRLLFNRLLSSSKYRDDKRKRDKTLSGNSNHSEH